MGTDPADAPSDLEWAILEATLGPALPLAHLSAEKMWWSKARMRLWQSPKARGHRVIIFHDGDLWFVSTFRNGNRPVGESFAELVTRVSDQEWRTQHGYGPLEEDPDVAG